ncbi:MFS transporter [Pelomyxa schiedti]|nr:MFS transporter [Pelomyxa schiedti]
MVMKLRTKASYVAVNFAMEQANSIFMLFGLWYMTDIALLSTGLAGTVAILYRIWDALNDPVVGYFSDQTHSKYGRRVPWMFWGTFPYVIAFLLFWSTPSGSQAWLFIFFLLVQCLLDGGYTSIYVPHISLLNDLTTDYTERFLINILRFVAQLLGSGSAFVAAALVFSIVNNPKTQFFVLAILICCVYAPCVFWCCYECKGIHTETRQAAIKPQTFAETMRNVVKLFKVKEFVIVFFQNGCCTVACQASIHVLPYLLINYMRLNATQLIVCILVTEGCGVVAASLLLTFGKDVPKRTLFFFGTSAWLSFYLCLPFLTPSNWYMIYPFAIVLGIGVATSQMIPISFVTDLGDYVDLALGRRMEGIIFAVIHCGFKIGVGIALLIFELLLHFVGFVPQGKNLINAGGSTDVVLPPLELAVERALRWYTFFVPGLLVIVAILMNKYNPICDAEPPTQVPIGILWYRKQAPTSHEATTTQRRKPALV